MLAAVNWDWEHLGWIAFVAMTFGVLGIALLAVGFKIFEIITPKLDVEQELAKGNMAVGVMVGAMLIAMALIVKMAIGG